MNALNDEEIELYQAQLEEELKRGDWLVLPAYKKIMFNTPDDMMWKIACKKLGIDLNNLAGPAGIS